MLVLVLGLGLGLGLGLEPGVRVRGSGSDSGLGFGLGSVFGIWVRVQVFRFGLVEMPYESVECVGDGLHFPEECVDDLTQFFQAGRFFGAGSFRVGFKP